MKSMEKEAMRMMRNAGLYNDKDGYLDCDGYKSTMHCCFALTDKNTPIRTFMHYSDEEAKGDPITVFGSASSNLFYNYDDRLCGDAWSEGLKKAKAKHEPKTAKFYEVALQHFHNEECPGCTIDLRHVMLGVNRSSGYSYLVFGYIINKKI